ncbi:hypothetical protein BDN70DRAFT_654319 [Pholiota conissans]|uniref:C2H2-type domain-containing protein n=1 Tax=Pholiota conissans TaxID=109636 RepID=A0A9P6D135_9AGAR|nr:hypothetical protein BDN70DRAFT_654319 [Pholiota conissans]
MDTANMYNQRPGDKNPVICPRFECGDLLPNAGALIYHLHIHDIEANLVICKTCKNTYEHGFDTHVCPKKPHRRVQWHSPLKLPSCSIQNCAQIKHIISSFIFAS